jgi:hypothetical protein
MAGNSGWYKGGWELTARAGAAVVTAAPGLNGWRASLTAWLCVRATVYASTCSGRLLTCRSGDGGCIHGGSSGSETETVTT